LNTSWDTIEGIRQTNEQEFEFSDQVDSYTHTSIRKAILLVRYTKFLKRYLKLRQASTTPDIVNEYQSMHRQFPCLVERFHQEMNLINDNTLIQQEYQYLLDVA
jgi:hypothetical protein